MFTEVAVYSAISFTFKRNFLSFFLSIIYILFI